MTTDLPNALRAWLTEHAPTRTTPPASTDKQWIEGWAEKRAADLDRAAALADADPTWLDAQPQHTRTAVATWRARRALKDAQ